MIPVFTLQNTDGIMLGVCLFLFLGSVFIKIAPKVALALMVGCLTLYVVFLRNTTPEKKATKYGLYADDFSEDTIAQKETNSVEEKLIEGSTDLKENKQGENEEKKVSRPKTPKAENPVVHQYEVSGFWKWDDLFVKAVRDKIGWEKVRKGDFDIEVGYTGVFRQIDANEKERKFIYSGGDIEIKINGTQCCCNDFISLPKGLSANSFPETKQLIQEEMTKLILKEKSRVIKKIKECLPY